MKVFGLVTADFMVQDTTTPCSHFSNQQQNQQSPSLSYKIFLLQFRDPNTTPL